MIDPQTTEQHDSVSSDSLFNGELHCYQHKAGYRFSIDSVLLAHFLHLKKGERILDLGTGSGIIAMIMLYRWQDRIDHVLGIELQPGLARMAEKNLQVNGLSRYGRVIHGDIKEIDKLIGAESYDKIVCNPPFYKPGIGRSSSNPEAKQARHQVLATLEEFLYAASFAVKNGGEVGFIYPAEQLCEFIVSAGKFRLEVKKMQFVYSYPEANSAARLVLFQCLKNGGRGVEILAPFYIYNGKNGEYSKEMQSLYKTNIEVSS